MSCYDLIIKNAKIVDGSGSPWFWGDVGVTGGSISFVGVLPHDACAEEVIDAKCQAVSPGFIDVHSHYDFIPFRDPVMLNKIKQGVTTQMIGPCGMSAAPIKQDKIALLDKYVGFGKGGAKIDYNWRSFGEYLDVLDKLGLGTNIAAYIGQGTIRINAMGFDNRRPAKDEMDEMKRLTRESMEEGAFGLTTGLIYPPGVFTEPDEIVELAKELKPFNGVYLSHMRNESYDIVNSVKEIVNVAEKADIPVQVHHHKACGKKNWGIVKETVKMVEDARKRGLDVTIDQYPYTSGSTTLRAILPNWVQEGGFEMAVRRLRDPASRARIINEIKYTDNWENMTKHCGGPKNVIVMYAPQTPQFEGKDLEEIGRMTEKDPLESALDVIAINKGCDTSSYIFISEDDVRYIMKSPLTMVGSDSIPAAPGAKCHPRTNGTFPRILGKYVREEGVLSLEEAVRKMTSFPAARFNMKKKGLIKEGMDADLVVFDPDTVIDEADFEDPLKDPLGISYVIVNGKLSLKNGQYTGRTAGRVIKRV